MSTHNAVLNLDVMAVEVTNFQSEVIDQSREKPVLVDFWAPWCGPCKILGPVLDKLANEASGEWVLAKLNTDENPSVSMQYGIRGIPAVKLFVDGAVVAEFTGALPEYAVRKWLDEHLPTADSETLQYATSLLASGELEKARALLEELDSPESQVLLAKLIVFTDPTRARDLVDGVDVTDRDAIAEVDAIKTLAASLTMHENEVSDGPGRPHFLSAIELTRSGDFDGAASSLIEVLKVDRYFADDAARKFGIALFNVLGPEHEVTRSRRRLFDMYLF